MQAWKALLKEGRVEHEDTLGSKLVITLPSVHPTYSRYSRYFTRIDLLIIYSTPPTPLHGIVDVSCMKVRHLRVERERENKVSWCGIENVGSEWQGWCGSRSGSRPR